MKKFIIYCAVVVAVGLASVKLFATGATAPNGYQVGVSTFSATSSLTQTNTFPIPYTCQPVIALSSTTTNNTPFSVSSVTFSNFILTVTTGSTTNNSVTWTASPGYPRMQSGTNAIVASVLYTNTFASPYAYAPVLSIEGSTTNGVGIAYSSPTNFVLSSTVSQSVSWISIGTAYAPGANAVTY